MTATRRERRRTETTAEIKEVALRLMAAGGPGAITLRAIAREMGMTANAVYSYFATRDDLVTALIRDVYGQLADAVIAARDARPGDDVAGRIMAWARAFRDWSVANPEGFRLVYGDPVPGYQPPEGGAAPEAEHRVCAGLTELAAGAWPTAAPLYADYRFEWSDFDPRLAEETRAEFPDLPPAVIAVALRIWGHLHGLVSLEIRGNLGAQTTNPEKLYRNEVFALLRSFGLTPPGD
ncbi:transcriptional repressor BetI [Nocardia otitidiscaviarum]|uniref:Transcriptional repressor BetI n=1 Tax=Nocardia otitidiscaviarum TaxID=1823 RepID=A0A378YLW1_9NOCA|nr:TetR/AcrR family transcriptional regulator [Nocardia otitidiscaviarum]MBF6181997.1 TetR/AcrR family transcriptional regulator [Nocardia otitidiscaviarum]SUA78175.1 transcriptional repressor BetI [Nocardia otitidiscaviarum]